MGEVIKSNNLKSNSVLNEKDYYKDKYIIKLLTLYMVNGDNIDARELLENIINKKCELNKKLRDIEFVNLLYISELLELNDKLLKSYPEYNIYKKSEVEDLKIFNVYKDYLNNEVSNLSYIIKRIEINNFKFLDSGLKLKVNRVFTKRVKELSIKKEKSKPIESLKKYNEYILIQNNNFNCCYCKNKMINTKINLARYNGVTEDIKDYIESKAYTCKRCDVIYLTSSYINEINSIYGS